MGLFCCAPWMGVVDACEGIELPPNRPLSTAFHLVKKVIRPHG